MAELWFLTINAATTLMTSRNTEGVGDPAIWGPAVSNSWRTTADISDIWWAMCELADLTARCSSLSSSHAP
jgi:hypothetical protein